MFDFLKKKEEAQHEPLLGDVLNPVEQKMEKSPMPAMEMPVPHFTEDFPVVEVKTKINPKGAIAIATFADLTTLSRKVPIFAFRDKRYSLYFALVEGKMFYYKK